MNFVIGKIPFYKENPVDIIIPYYNECDKVLQLCKSIWANTRQNPYKIYLVDDCSPSKTFIYAFRKAPHTVMIRNDKQLGFGGSLQEGFKVGKNPWVVFMHSDCVIDRPTWIIDLMDSYINLARSKVVMVSPRTDDPVIENSILKAPPNAEPIPDVVLKEGFLPLYCALSRRELFKTVSFIKNYPFRGYEDEEFAFRLRKQGFFQGVSGRSWIQHIGSATVRNIPHYDTVLENNRIQCLKDLRG